MNAKLTNAKTKTTIVFGEVASVEIVGESIIVNDIYKQQTILNTTEWSCVCSEYAVCCDCGKQFLFDDETCAIYRGDFLCSNCYQDKYGYCNECGELNKYADMNEDIVCKGCE